MSLDVFRMRNRRKSGDENSGLPSRIPSLALLESLPPRPSSRVSSTPSSTPSSPSSDHASFSSLDAQVSSTIAEVLNRPPAAVDASTVSALATKAQGLASDNKRLRTEMRSLAADRAEMAREIERLRSAMRDIVRVAEIIAIPNCACRSSSAPTSPASESFASN